MLYFVCIAVFTIDVGLLARSQCPEGPATGHLDTCFSRFPCVYKQTLRRFPTFQVATTCFSCSPPDLNLLVTNSIFCIHVKKPLPPGDNPIAVNKYYYVWDKEFGEHKDCRTYWLRTVLWLVLLRVLSLDTGQSLSVFSFCFALGLIWGGPFVFHHHWGEHHFPPILWNLLLAYLHAGGRTICLVGLSSISVISASTVITSWGTVQVVMSAGEGESSSCGDRLCLRWWLGSCCSPPISSGMSGHQVVHRLGTTRCLVILFSLGDHLNSIFIIAESVLGAFSGHMGPCTGVRIWCHHTSSTLFGACLIYMSTVPTPVTCNWLAVIRW